LSTRLLSEVELVAFLEDAAGWLGEAEMEKLKGGNAQELLKL